MIKLCLKFLVIFSIAFILFNSTTDASIIAYGPQPFTSSSGVSFMQFDPSLGKLSSVVYKISDTSITDRKIFDVDDYLGPLTINNITHRNLIRIGSYFILEANSTLTGSTFGDEDGDGNGIYDGGVDEIGFDIFHNNLSGSISITDATILASYIGTNPMVSLVWVYNPTTFDWLGRDIEQFNENLFASGNFTLEYHYLPVPLPPSVILLLTGGILVFPLKTKRKS